MDISAIEQWIIDFLKEQCEVDAVATGMPLFEYLDSFEVINFFLACDDQYHCFETFDPSTLTGLDIAGVAAVIAQRQKSAIDGIG
jgi:hypothetical protein